MGNVRETWWADADRDRYTKLAEALPEVLESVFTDWQTRVDAPHQVPVTPSVTVYSIKASRQIVEDRQYYKLQRPAEPREERNYLVAADTLSQAWGAVSKHLEAHEPGSRWALSSNTQVLVIDGTVQES